MNKVYIMLLLFGICATTQAQDSLSVSMQKKINKTVQIDLFYGPNIDLSHRPEGNLLSTFTDRKRTVPAIGIRILHFPSKRWGWYFDLRMKIAGKNADRSQEIYRPFEPDYYINENNRYSYPSEYSGVDQTNTNFNLGVAYRIENKKWAFYPKLGLGTNCYTFRPINAQLKGKGNNELYAITVLLPDPYDETINIFTATLGISANYKLSKHCYLLADISYVQPLKSVHIDYILKDLYTGQEIRKQTYRSSTLGRDLSVSIGFGFPIYLNKQKKAGKEKNTMRERMKTIMEQKRKAFGLFPNKKAASSATVIKSPRNSPSRT